MKRFLNWRITLGVFLVALSALIYYLHFILFQDSHHIFIYLIGDIAFVPIEVLMVTLIIHHVMESRAKRALMKKMNMLIGTFYSDTGTNLLSMFASFDPGREELRSKMNIEKSWQDVRFKKIFAFLNSYEFNIDVKKRELSVLAEYLTGKIPFMLNLLSNPNLLEHETFTNVLWAVFHLAEELSSREDLEKLPDTDIEHLSNDIKRAYKACALQWLSYMKHLKNNYPYLYSLAMRKNPFITDASVMVY
jgi:hypothetical protein